MDPEEVVYRMALHQAMLELAMSNQDPNLQRAWSNSSATTVEAEVTGEEIAQAIEETSAHATTGKILPLIHLHP